MSGATEAIPAGSMPEEAITIMLMGKVKRQPVGAYHSAPLASSASAFALVRLCKCSLRGSPRPPLSRWSWMCAAISVAVCQRTISKHLPVSNLFPFQGGGVLHVC